MIIRLGSLEDGVSELTHEHSRDSLDIDGSKEIGSSFNEPIHVKTTINKVGQQFFLKIGIDAIAQFDCDRCLVRYSTAMRDSLRLVYTSEKLELHDETDQDGDIRLIKSDSGEVDVTRDIREALLLLIPIKKTCTEACRGICPQCGANLNSEQCNHEAEKTDPRWDALKKLVH